MNRVPNRNRLSRRAKWDLALAISGFAYVVLTLTLSLSAPVFSLLFLTLAGRELIVRRDR